MNRVKFMERVADVIRNARTKSGFSQEYVAKSIGVSKKTYQNIEEGYRPPNIIELYEIFEAIDQPFITNLLKIYFPRHFLNLTHGSSDLEIKEAVQKYMAYTTPEFDREFMVLCYGDHNRPILEELDFELAFLNLSLEEQIAVRQTILTIYELKLQRGETRMDHIQPNLNRMKLCIEKLKDASLKGRQSVSMIDEDIRVNQ